MSEGICCSADRNMIIGRPMIHHTVTSATVSSARLSLVSRGSSGRPSALKNWAMRPRSGISASFQTSVISVTEKTDAQKKVARRKVASRPWRFSARASISDRITKMGVLMRTKRMVFHTTWWKTSSPHSSW